MTGSTLKSRVGQDQDVLTWLKSLGAYQHPVATVEQIETHVSHVFLVGEYVYKLKKPVHFDFLDLRLLSARELACREEVRLNRRLAPSTYLGVVAIKRNEEGQLALGGDGEVVDWLVKMRRLPKELMLDELVHQGKLRPYQVDDLAKVLCAFYQRVRDVFVSPDKYRERCLKHVQDNLKELRQSLPTEYYDAIDRAHAFQLQLLHCQPELFDNRVQAGRIVEGHGDLRPEHVCFTEPVTVFDCIEFGEEFRSIDIADELAFLAAECGHLGAAWVGPNLFDRYERISGDHVPQVLIDFYKSYRASVRAKVAALRAQQLASVQRTTALREAARHVEAADHFAHPHNKPLILVVGGLSGSGKSTLAREMAQKLSARLLSSDQIRRELSGRPESGDGLISDKYSKENRDRIYVEMLRQAEELHRAGLSVLLDATFENTRHLQAAASLSRNARSHFLAIECRCPPSLIRRRIEHRRVTGEDASEATLGVFEAQLVARHLWPETVSHVQIDTNQPLARQVSKAFEALKAGRRTQPRALQPEGNTMSE